ncbi:MAG: Ig-like domain-containing protein [Gemmatimonadetes bacterium]|nr:Ig-like domain-containing protein [Gemmatimonadota bacterium]
MDRCTAGSSSRGSVLIGLVAVVLGAACWPGASTDDPLGIRQKTTIVGASPNPLTVEVGQTLPVIVSTSINGTLPRVTSRDPSIAGASVSANGPSATGNGGVSTVLVNGIAEGQTVLEIRGPTDPAVVPPFLVSVTVVKVNLQVSMSPTFDKLAPGQSRKFVCTVTRNGQTIANPALQWGSSATTTATVAPDGTVTGVSDGTAIIACRLATGESATAQVVVESPLTVDITPGSHTIAMFQTATFKCAVRQGQTVLTGRQFRWSTSDASVATVDQNGNVLGVSDGTATITCEDLANRVSASGQVTVRPATTSVLCDPQQTPEADVLANLSSIMGLIDRGFCSFATRNVHTGPVTPSSPLMPTKSRALDHTSFRIVGGVPSWSMSPGIAQILNSVYPCGRNSQGAVTLCGSNGPAPLPAGDYIMTYGVLHKPIPLSDPNNMYQYGFVFDSDGSPGNNFVPDPNFPGDFFGGGGNQANSTDFWVKVTGRPGINWEITAVDARNNNVRTVTTDARVIIDGATMFAIIPRSHFGVDAPRARFTAFRHGGSFGFDGNYDADVQRPVNQPLYTLPILPPATAADRLAAAARR